jgi:hypothetical protein
MSLNVHNSTIVHLVKTDRSMRAGEGYWMDWVKGESGREKVMLNSMNHCAV